MAFPRVEFDTYTALRDMDISHPDIDGSWRLGQMTSWTRWGNATGDLSPITASTAEEFDQLPPFSTRVILFAINLGGTSMSSELEDWRNFHSQNHRGDSTLKNTMKKTTGGLTGGDAIPAFYMTDVFKLVPTANAAQLDAKIKADRAGGIDHVERCAAILREELKLCLDGAGGHSPTLIAIGDAAFFWLTGKGKKDSRIAEVVDEVLGDGASKGVRRMDHYTFGSGSHESRTAVLQPLLQEIIDEK